MSDLPPGRNIASWPNIINLNYNYNYHLGDGNSTNNNFIYNNLRASEESTDAIAIIEKALGQHHLPAAVFVAQPDSAGCMLGTRVQFLEEVHALLTSRTGPHIAWITGMAGTGKTSIALTLCQLLWYDATVYLGGSFFCSRSTGTVERTHVQRIVPTLANVLARQLPEYASVLAKQLAKQPDIAHWSVSSQIECLLTLPLAELGRCDGQIVFVIDALDECSDQGKLVELIDALVDFKSVVPVKFMLTSRPEMFIRRTPISDPKFSTVLRLHTIDPTLITADLRLYIAETLARASDATKWYTHSDVEALVQRSGGLFIFASTVLKYILDRFNDDGRRDRLRKITEAMSRSTASTAPLDKVYEFVLTEATRPDRVDDDELSDTRRVLACILTARASLSIQVLADLIEVSPGNLRGALERLPSLVYIPEDDTKPGIRTLHASFGDYIFERAAIHIRIAASFGHDNLTHGCLRRMAWSDLCFNVSRSWSSFEPNSDEAPDWVAPSLLYACFHWVHHLNAASDTSGFDTEVGRTFQQKFLFWLEVLSVMKKLGLASGFLRIAGSVVKQQTVVQFFREANSFVVSSYDAIARSAPHIYISALPFAAKDSLIRQYFASHCTGVISVDAFDVDSHGGSFLMTITGHEASVTLVAYSQDNRHLVSSSEDNTVRVWNAQTGEEVMPPMGVDHHSVLAVAFTSGDKRVAVISANERLRVKHISTQHEFLYTLHGGVEEFTSAAFSPDGALVATGRWGGRVHIWSTETRNQMFSFKFDTTASRLKFSPSGRLLAGFMYHSETIELWDRITGQCSGHPLTTEGRVSSLAISPDSIFLAAAGSEKATQLWNLETPELDPIVPRCGGGTAPLAFAPDGVHLLDVIDDHVRLWNYRANKEAAKLLHGHSKGINSVSYSPDGLYVASASSDKTIRVRDIPDSRNLARRLPEPSVVTCVAVAPGNTFIVSGSLDGSVHVWNVQTGEQKLRLQRLTRSSNSNDGSILSDRTRPIQFPVVRYVPLPPEGQGTAVSVAISSDEQLIALGSDLTWKTLPGFRESWIWLWSAQTGELIQEFTLGSDCRLLEMVFSLDNLQLATSLLEASGQAVVRVWELTAIRRFAIHPHRFTEKFRRPKIAFSPDGRLLVAAVHGDSEVRLWWKDSGASFGATFGANCSEVCFLAFSHDGSKLITGHYNGTVLFHNAGNGLQLSIYTVDSGIGIVDWVACSPNERFIVRISHQPDQTSRTMRIWDTTMPDMVTAIRVNDIWNGAATFSANSQSIIIGQNDRTMVWQVETLCRLAAGPRSDPLTQFLRGGLDKDGWVKRPSGELLLWIPPEYREYVQLPCTLVIGTPRVVITSHPTGLHYGEEWTSCWRNATE